MNKIPKTIEAELHKSYKSYPSTRWPGYYPATDKANEWLTKNIGLTSCINETVIGGYIFRFNWNAERWFWCVN